MSGYPFSIGSIPEDSEVYIISQLSSGNYWFSLYIINGMPVFQSVDPNINKPTAFTYKKWEDGISLTGPTGYLTSDLSATVPLTSYPQEILLKPQSYSLNEDTVYVGVEYISGSTTSFAGYYSDLEGQSVPWGGAGPDETAIQTYNIIFVPVYVPQDIEFNTPYQYVNGSCKSPTSITPFLSEWMLGNYGCKTSNPEGCIFSTLAMCETHKVIPYCLQGETCGNCIGSCPEGQPCVYDYSRTTAPYYSCNPVQPSPTEEATQNVTLLIIIIVIVLIVIIILFVILSKSGDKNK